MMIKPRFTSVITGDLVESRKSRHGEELLRELKSSIEVTASHIPSRFQLFRGDSFQIEVPEIESALRFAIIVRAHLRTNAPDKEEWDARVAVGIGEADSGQRPLNESTGRAFVLSGKGLDEMDAARQRLCIRTQWKEVDRQLDLLTRFADDIISNWSYYSAEVAWQRLLFEKTQLQIGDALNKKQPTIHARLKTAKLELIERYLERVNEVVNEAIARNDPI